MDIDQGQQQIRAELAAMHAQNERELAAIRAVVAAAGVAAARPPAAPVRLAPAPRFNGTTPSLDTWLSVIVQHCVYYQQNSDDQRLRFAYGNLEGPALVWFTALGDAHAPRTWGDFVSTLRGQYQPISTADTARARIDKLTMGKKPVNVYVASFRELAVPLAATDAATMMHYFRKGLSLHLQDIVFAHHPATLDEMITLAVRIGAGPVAQAATSSPMEICAADGGPGAEESRDADDPDAPITARSLAMLLNSMQMRGNGHQRGGQSSNGAPRDRAGGRWPSGLPRIDGFTEEKTREFMEEHKCFGCASTEHSSRRCPKKRFNPTTGKPSWPK